MNKDQGNFTRTEWNGYPLPSWLFYKKPIDTSFVSPAASFNPATALNGNPWQSTTSPSQKLQAKTLVIDRSIFINGLFETDVLSQIEWFKLQEIIVYLCIKEKGEGRNEFISCNRPRKEIEDAITKLSLFDENTDYESLAADHQLERDYTAVLNFERSKQLFACMHDQKRHFLPLNSEDDFVRVNSSHYSTHIPSAIAERATVLKLDKDNIVVKKQTVESFRKIKEDSSFLYSQKPRHPEPLFAASSDRQDETHQTKKFTSLNLLSDYIKSHPESADIIIRSYLNFIKTELLEKTGVDIYGWSKLELTSYWLLLKNANVYKQAMDDMLDDQTKIENWKEYCECNPPNVAEFIKASKASIEKDDKAFEKIGEIKRLKAHVWLPILNSAPDLADVFIEVFNLELTYSWLKGIKDKSVARKLYEQSELTVRNEFAVLTLLGLYPEKYDEIIIEHKEIFDNFSSGLDGLVGLPDEIIFKLMERFNNRITFSWHWDCKESITWCHQPSMIQKILTAEEKFGSRNLLRWADIYQQFPLLQQRFAEQVVEKGMVDDSEDERKNSCFNNKNKSSYGSFTSMGLPRKLFASGQLKTAAKNKVKSMVALPMSARPTEKPKFNQCTKLSIGKLDGNVTLNLREFANIRQLSINIITASYEYLEQFFAELKEHCPKLLYVELPENVRSQTMDLPYHINYVSPIRVALLEEKKPLPELAKMMLQISEFRYRPQPQLQRLLRFPEENNNSNNHHVEPERHTKNVFIANNGLKSSTVTQEEKSRFNMQKCGELLNANGHQPHRIRTGIIELSDDFTTQRYHTPKLVQIEPPEKITDALIQDCKLADDGFYYYKMTVAVEPNQPQCLLSADADETLLGYSVSDDSKVDFFRGDDDFFYIKSDKACTFEYIIKAPHPDETLNLDRLSDNDPVKQIICDYILSPKFQPTSDKNKLIKKGESVTQWFDRSYKSPGGSCQERCQAVWYQIHKDNKLADRVRIVRIGNNHVRLEIKTEDGRCVQVDLGGMQANTANLSYNNVDICAARSAAVQQSQQPQKQPVLLIKKHNPIAQKTLTPLKRVIQKTKKPTVVYQIAQVFDEPSPVMLINKNVRLIAKAILRHAKSQQIPVFYLNGPSKVSVDKEQIHLESEEPSISNEDALDLFIKQHQHNPDAIILINWEAFTPQQKVALNTVLDERQSLYGKQLNFKVLSLCEEKPKDNSFKSRHKKIVQPCVLPDHDDFPFAEVAQDDVDLNGLPNWQEALFGPIVLDEGQLCWKRSKLIDLLETKLDNPLVVNLKNVPYETMAEVNSMIQLAKARGYFEYHHKTIVLPDNVRIKINKRGFNFKQFNPLTITQNVNAEQVPSSAKLVNTILFDYLLSNKTISEGEYNPLPGWLEQAQDKDLELFITTNLSDNQWYCLLNFADHYGVKLTVYTAKDVKPPASLALNEMQPAEDERLQVEENEPVVIVSNSPTQLCDTLDDDKDCYVFAVEDYNYQDLIDWIQFRFEDNQFCDFNRAETDIVKCLQEGKKVVLYGEFSAELLQALHPLLMSQCADRDKQWSGKLVLVVDENSFVDMDFLPPSMIKHVEIQKLTTPKNPVVYEEKCDDDRSLENSREKTEKFIDQRLNALADAIVNNPITLMEGHTGIGKTFLMRELKCKMSDQFTVYHEFDNITDWAEDNSDKVKVFFLDETFINDKHLTMFAPLKRVGNPRILINGTIHELTSKHRLVCASNKLEYGGGRVKQKLFEESGIAKINLDEMPTYFIYERLLKPIYESVKPDITEAAFQKKCIEFLAEYKQRRQSDALTKVCVRDIQEWVLLSCAKKQGAKSLPFFKRSTEDASHIDSEFVITPSLKPLYNTMRSAIRIRKKRFLTGSSDVFGLNGCLVEGRPGMGKSELVAYSLYEAGYVQLDPNEKAPHNTPSYVKLDASIPQTLLRKQIRKAFNEGQIVWLDEVNSCFDTGFEKWINAFLSGFDPDTHEPAEQPGFMLLVTANSIGMEGRKLLGPAFRGRLTELEAPDPTVIDLKVIIEDKLPELCEEEVDTLAAAVHAVMQEDDEPLSLRDVVPNLHQYAKSLFEKSRDLDFLTPYVYNNL